MAYTTTQLQALDDAIASGELTVEYDGKKVTYRSIPELIAARDLVKAELIASGAIAADTAPRVSYVSFDRN